MRRAAIILTFVFASAVEAQVHDRHQAIAGLGLVFRQSEPTKLDPDNRGVRAFFGLRQPLSNRTNLLALVGLSLFPTVVADPVCVPIPGAVCEASRSLALLTGFTAAVGVRPLAAMRD